MAFRCWAGGEKTAVCCELPAKAGDWAREGGGAAVRRNSRAARANAVLCVDRGESWVVFGGMGVDGWVGPTSGGV